MLLRLSSLVLLASLAAQAQIPLSLRFTDQVMTDAASPTFFAGTSAGLFQSVDNRATWTPVALMPIDGPQPAVEQLIFDPARATRLYAAGPQHIFRSEDNGATWVQADSGLPTEGELVQFYIAQQNLYVQMREDLERQVYKSTDMGTSWAFHVALPARASHLEIHPLNSNLWYYAHSRSVFRSPDEGRTWLPTGNFPIRIRPGNQIQNAVASIRVDPQFENQILMSTLGPVFAPEAFANGVFFSEDQAGSWERVFSTGAQETTFTDGPTIAWRSESSSVWISDDRGRSFAGPFDFGTGSRGAPAFLADRRNNSILYGDLRRSTDRGRTWADRPATVLPAFGPVTRTVEIRASMRRLGPVFEVVRVVAFGNEGWELDFTVAAPEVAWLAVEPVGGETPEALSVRADPRNLEPGEYRATVELNAPGSFNQRSTFEVVLTVTNEPPPASSPIISTFAGNGRSGDDGDGGLAVDARLSFPDGIDVDSRGRVLIAQWLLHRVRRVDLDGMISTVAGTGERGFSGDDGPAAQAQLASPQDVAVGPDDSIYIADNSNRRVRRVDPNGIISTFAGTGEFGIGEAVGQASELAFSPNSLDFSGDGALFVTGSLFRIAPDGTYRRWSRQRVGGVAVGPDGVVYATVNNQVLVMRSDDTSVVFAGRGDLGYSGDGGPAVEALLSNPSDVAVDNDGRVFIADTDNHVVRMVEDGIISTYAGLGAEGFSGDGGPANVAQLDNPVALGIGLEGELYIADQGNRRVRVVAAPGANQPTLGGLSNAASFQAGDVAPAEIISLFGTNFATELFVATATPLPTTLGGVTLELIDSTDAARQLCLFFVGPNQVNAEIHPEAALGPATLRLTKEDGGTAELQIQIVAVAPGMFSANANGQGVAAAAAVRVDSNGAQSPVTVLNADRPVTGRPIELGSDTVVLLLFGTGLRNFEESIEVTIGGMNAQVVGLAPQPDFVGLDQLNVIIPAALAGAGEVEVVVTIDGVVANTVTIVIA